jgi:hypothetical protein
MPITIHRYSDVSFVVNTIRSCRISGSHSGDYEELLRYNAVQSSDENVASIYMVEE